MSGTDGLASSLLGMRQGQLQMEIGVKVASRVLDAAREEGASMVGMVRAAANVMEAGQKGFEKGVGEAIEALDVYA